MESGARFYKHHAGNSGDFTQTYSTVDNGLTPFGLGGFPQEAFLALF